MMRYRAEIDGLRALAVMPVILFHAGVPFFAGGYVGVDVFFVISGYLITSLIASEKAAGTFTIKLFYERRIRRILPGLFLVMLVSLPFAWFWMLPSELKDFSKSLMAVVVFSSNIFFWREGGYFETPGEYKPLLHTWTLAVEEQYYLFFPLFMLLVWRFRKHWVGVIFVAIAIVSFVFAEWGSKNHPQGAFYLLPSRGWELLLGATIALYFFQARPETLTARENPSISNQVAAAVGLLLIVYAVVMFDRTIPYPGFYALIPTLGTALVILGANHRTFVGKVLSSPALVGIGLISYSAYLWHQPIFAFARIRYETALNASLLAALSVAALICAFLSWKYIEKPFRNRQLVGRKTIIAAACAMTLLFLTVGFAGYASNGFAYRYSANDQHLAALDLNEAGNYVERRFIELELRPFDVTARKKILVIGDSYAQDIVNAAYEGGLTSQFQFSTHWIPTRCGNLFLDKTFASHIEDDRRTICSNAGWYDGSALRRLMSEADAIWIASNWTEWEAQLLPDSIEQLKRVFRGSVRVFGPKHLGQFTVKGLLRHPEHDRLKLRSTMLPSQIELNQLMKSTLPTDNFVDVSNLICGSTGTCPLFTDDGELISFDGGHLTKDGAAYLGRRLAAIAKTIM